MKCSKAKKLIGDHMDGDLDTKIASELEEHLEACPACRKLFEDFERIADKAKTLVKKKPSGKVWFRIIERLKEESQEKVSPARSRRDRFLLFPVKVRYAVSAALLLLVVIGGVFIGYLVLNQGIFSKGDNGQEYALKKIKEAEKHYQLAIEALWEAVQAQRENFDPEVAEIFLINLKLIDASLAECKKAVQGDPGNLDSRYYLLAVYKKKAELLDNMMEISSTSSETKESNSIL